MSQAISDSNLSIRHISKYEDRNTYGISRIINAFSAFEGEFGIYFNDEKVRSDRYYESKELVIKTLKELVEKQSGKKSKKDIQDFVNLIENLKDSLKQQLDHSIKEHFNVIKPFIKYEYGEVSKKKIDSLTTRMNKLRNSIAMEN